MINPTIINQMFKDPAFWQSVEAAAKQQTGDQSNEWFTRSQDFVNKYQQGSQGRIAQADTARQNALAKTKPNTLDYVLEAAPLVTTLLGGLFGGNKGAAIGGVIGRGAQGINRMHDKIGANRAQTALADELARIESEQKLTGNMLDYNMDLNQMGYDMEQDRLSRADAERQNQIEGFKYLDERGRANRRLDLAEQREKRLGLPSASGGLTTNQIIDLLQESALMDGTQKAAEMGLGPFVTDPKTGRTMPMTIQDLMQQNQDLLRSGPDSSLYPYVQQYLNAPATALGGQQQGQQQSVESWGVATYGDRWRSLTPEQKAKLAQQFMR